MSLRTSTSTGQMNCFSFPYYHSQMSSTSSTSAATTSSSTTSPPDMKKGRGKTASQYYYQGNSNCGTIIYSTTPSSQSNYFPKNEAEKVVEVTNLSSPPGKLELYEKNYHLSSCNKNT
uniref:PDZ domain-containing protein n=1 Tax=Strongyloides stercoralis TaxID=6248 RepID=A0AAF5DE26_STRER